MNIVDSFMANLQHAIRNQEGVCVGGGLYSTEELQAVYSFMAIATADNTLHGAVDYWQERALTSESKLT